MKFPRNQNFDPQFDTIPNLVYPFVVSEFHCGELNRYSSVGTPSAYALRILPHSFRPLQGLEILEPLIGHEPCNEVSSE